MQKVKRKFNDDDASSPKKKKVNTDKTVTKPVQGDHVKNKNFKKDFKKDGFKGPNKFGKPNFSKDQSKFGKGKSNFSKDQNKDGKGKPNFSKDQANGEKPKWSEMKKEKKELRLVRRKAKATAEVFEVSHKAKLLAAQIQR